MQTFLSICDLRKAYRTGNTFIEALKGVSFQVYRGEILALLGVNGAGKTTLSSILAGLHPPTSGTVAMGQRPIHSDIVAFRRQVGLCPQQCNLDSSLTLKENLLFGGRYYGLSEAKVRSRVDLLVEQFGLNRYVECKTASLSGGYRQRFLIARALVHEPWLVILDEPTVGLDPHIRHHLWELILGLKRDGITVLLTTHYMDEADHLADRVCIIDGGLVKSLDTPANLKAKYGRPTLEEVFLEFVKAEKKGDDLHE